MRILRLVLSELRDLISQVVELDHGHVTLYLDSETWRNVARQFIYTTVDYWPWLLFVTLLGVLIGIALTR